jgi:BirA family transcriptional regulator, biotin operon repressor / biotin---[acetyl-CoA-carboxylase] ligase
VSAAASPPLLGLPRVHLRKTSSTNDRARELAIAGAPSGTLVTASEQTAGRGRGGRRWSAPANSSLLASVLLRSPSRLLPLIAPLAVCDIAGPRARIKWPNDVVAVDAHELRKLAGILIEGRPQEAWAVLGIGLNVAVELSHLPLELRETAATLGLPASEIEPLLGRLLRALSTRLAEPPAATLAAWRALDALSGREVSWAGGSGRAEGIDGDGRLVVARAGGGRSTLDAGEVHLAPVSPRGA